MPYAPPDSTPRRERHSTAAQQSLEIKKMCEVGVVHMACSALSTAALGTPTTELSLETQERKITAISGRQIPASHT